LRRETVAEIPADVPARLGLGNALRSQGMLDDAIAAYREAVVLKPDDPATHLELARALGEKRLREEATSEYREAIRLKPDDPAGHSAFAGFLHGYGDVGAREAELAEYREAVRLHTRGTPWSHANLVSILSLSPERQLRNPAEALEQARKAVEITQGGHPTFQTMLALAAYRSGLYEEALEALDKAKALVGYQEDALVLFLMAMIHGQKGEKEQARPWFDKAVAWLKAQS
jgi:tetratricopeptide (TPR) repeat protein